MKNIFVVLFFAVMLVGCDRSNPTDSTMSSTGTDVPFSEVSMLKTATVATTLCDSLSLPPAGPVHDSLRNVQLLDSLIKYVSLNSAQTDSVKLYAKTMLDALKALHLQAQNVDHRRDSLRAHPGGIPKDSIMLTVDSLQLQVKIIRNQFVASVKSILTPDQVILFDVWITKFWDDGKHRGGLGGFGGRGDGHEGHGGNHHGGR